MPLKVRCLIVIMLALLIAGSLPAGAKRKHAAVARHQSSNVRHRSTRSVRTAVVAKRATGRSRKHSIIRTATTRSRGGKKSTHLAKHHASPKQVVPEPHAENVQDSQSLASVYRLYDQGVNARLEGHYDQATKTLLEATNSYSSTKRGLTLEAMIDYELGQAAEENNNYSLAADAYTRSLRIKPTLVEAAVRLASMLMRAGHPQAALSRARETVALNPMDPRAHQILALVLDKNGLPEDARAELEKANRLLRSGSSVNTDPIDRTLIEQAPPTSPPDFNSQQGVTEYRPQPPQSKPPEIKPAIKAAPEIKAPEIKSPPIDDEMP